MAIRQIRVLGDDILRKDIQKEVKKMTPRMHTLVEDMYDHIKRRRRMFKSSRKSSRCKTSRPRYL